MKKGKGSKKACKSAPVRYMTMKLTEAGKYRVEQIRIAAGQETAEAVVFAAIRDLGKKYGIKVPKYTEDDVFRIARLGLVPSGNVQPLQGRSRNADIVIPLVGTSKWYDELKTKVGVTRFEGVVKLAMAYYDDKYLGT